MPKNSRTKGRNGEYQIIEKLKDLYPDVKRHLEMQAQEAELGVDLDNTKPFLVQVKLGTHVPKTNYKFIEQIKPQLDQYEVVCMRRDRKDWLVMMKLDSWLEIITMLKKEEIL